MPKKNTSFIKWCENAMQDRGFTHLVAADGTTTSLRDIVNRKIKSPRAPRGCYWAGNGASLYPNITLYSEFGENLGYYRLIKQES
jgi:hypothetical protein